VDFHPSRPFAYVVNELSSSVSTYAFNARTGALQPLQILPSTPSSFTGNNTGAEIAVSKSGRFVYVSNRGHNSIGVFAISAADGTLSPVAWEPTQGGTPRYFGIDPSGTHLYAANQTTDTVVVFRIDDASGKLTPTGEVLKVGAPCTIAWLG
jgi:6-phosphogluconolactonase (cycloisomerase 2 family)